ncbi:unnamed protein product [Ceratitis capitata]|uniref:(Mediterranean fruit fly) hypothetical protein n=1 Tax=Ceratitis capitata TaxID=7213 RepID=A0A811UGF6_CERCA|nr:unnamed protein product [Ceratitis capitata]
MKSESFSLTRAPDQWRAKYSLAFWTFFVFHPLLLLRFLSAPKPLVLRKVAVIVYTALDYNLAADEQCQMSHELEELITYMTAEENDDDCIDEGIDEGHQRWDDEGDDEKWSETKEFDFVLEACKSHIKPTVPEEHYKAVCRALVTEAIELRIFLQQVLNDGADNLHLDAGSQTSKQELAKLGFNDWVSL